MQNLIIFGKITPEMDAQLRAEFLLHYIDDLDDPKTWLKEHGASFKYALSSGHAGIKPEFMDSLTGLKIISNYSVGYEAINIPLIQQRGIIVTHTPNVLNAETSTTAIMLLLACYRDFNFNEAHARGLGRIGQAIADKLMPFNARVLYHGRSKKDVPYEFFDNLQNMAQEADALICITTGGPETKHDETAMIECLEDGRLGWAGLDVFENEPNIPERLKALSNTVLTPHIGSATHETRAAMGKLAVDNLIQFLKTGTVKTAIPECADC